MAALQLKHPLRGSLVSLWLETKAMLAAMRADGDTWATIGWILGTSGQAAQQRYGSGRV